MKLLEKCLYRFCLVICISSAVYMTYLQFKYYLNNEDLASISYRKFNTEEKDEYPTISICLSNYGGHIFKQDHDVFKSINVTRQSYLLGYSNDDLDLFSGIAFDDVVLDVHDGFLVSTHELGSHSSPDLPDFFDFSKKLHFPMVPTFRDPDRVCISKLLPFRKNNKQYSDSVQFDSSRLYDNELEVEVYVHQKEKLVRNLPSPIIVLPSNEKFEKGIKVVFDIGQVDILRKRENSKITCNQRITNEHQYILEEIMIRTGCIPAFWLQYAERIGLNQAIQICKSKNDYEMVRHRLIDARTGFRENNSTYKQPCTQMITSVTTKEMEIARPKSILSNILGTKKFAALSLTFMYHQDMYREITNFKA